MFIRNICVIIISGQTDRRNIKSRITVTTQTYMRKYVKKKRKQGKTKYLDVFCYKYFSFTNPYLYSCCKIISVFQPKMILKKRLLIIVYV